jgi:thiosulfate dehydrogenase [quinone] large subunit
VEDRGASLCDSPEKEATITGRVQICRRLSSGDIGMNVLKMMLQEKDQSFSTYQLLALTSLRVLIGWHFLYEGMVKLSNPNWSSSFYLLNSKGIFSFLFQKIAIFPPTLKAVDLMNMWGLILIGASLILGLYSRYAYLAGIALLALYYISMPPFIGYTYSGALEGNYLLVNKNLIEIFALIVLSAFPTSRITGLDMFAAKYELSVGKAGYES